MSRSRDVSSLTCLCLQNIAENMQSVWMTDYTDKNMEEYNFMYIEGPFNQLAGPLVQHLIRILGDSHKLTKAGLHLLLQPHLTELSLRPCAALVSNAIVQLVTVRCKLLTSLDLHSCSRVPAASLASLVQRLPRLLKLCLSDTQCDAQVLAAVGASCLRLRELDVSRCKKISPPALLSLVYEVRSGRFRCQALRALLLRDVKPPPGDAERWLRALCFVLLALPCLEQLANASLVDALRLLHLGPSGFPPDGFPSLDEVVRSRTCGGATDVQSALQDTTLRLQKLEDLEEEDVATLGSLCRGLQEVNISLRSGGHHSWSLIQWPSLSRLILHCPEQPLRSLEEILPALHPVCARLRLLSLQNLLWGHHQSLSTLMTWSPGLHSFQGHFTGPRLVAAHDAPQLPPWSDAALPLPHLHTFSLLLEEEDAAHPVFSHHLGGLLLSLLRGSPKLESLTLCRVPAPLDAVLEVLYGSEPPQPLQRLREVSLCSSNITQWGASLLLRAPNDLKSLDLSHCKEVTCRDYQHLQERAPKGKRRVTITWQ